MYDLHGLERWDTTHHPKNKKTATNKLWHLRVELSNDVVMIKHKHFLVAHFSNYFWGLNSLTIKYILSFSYFFVHYLIFIQKCYHTHTHKVMSSDRLSTKFNYTLYYLILILSYTLYYLILCSISYTLYYLILILCSITFLYLVLLYTYILLSYLYTNLFW